MPATYNPIATTTLGSANSTITFSSIPGTYTDLVLVLSSLSASASTPIIRFNSDTGNNYSWTRLVGTGSAAQSGRLTSLSYIEIAYSALSSTIPSLGIVNVFNYANTSTNKTILCSSSQDQNGSGSTQSSVGLWRNTSAITTITITMDGGFNFAANTTATLYGILKA